MGGRGGRRSFQQGRLGGAGNIQATRTNKIKNFHNLHYCFTCGYNVDRPGNACPVADTTSHIPNIPTDEAHIYANQGAIMVAQKKSLLDGTGAVMEWILTNNISKAQFLMQRQQEFAKKH